MAAAKKQARRGSQPAPRALRIISSRAAEPPAAAVATTTAVVQTEQAEQPEPPATLKPDDKDDLPIALDIKEIEFVDGVAQLPIAMLTLDVPLIPFKRKVVDKPLPEPFPFLELPSELRIRVYEYYFSDVDDVLDLDPTNYKRYHKLLGFMRVCRQIHSEATYLFYSTHSFMIFPVHPARQKHKKPILFRLKPRQRECLTTLDMRFGPNWNSPPRSWVVNDTLGLQECTNVTQLNVFVECDISDGIFKGWVRKQGFYETFTQELLAQVIRKLPSLRVIRFDAWPSVKKHGRMMVGLLDVVRESKLTISWGPERGWTDALDEDEEARPRANMWEPLTKTPSSFSSNNLLVMA